MNFHSNLPLEQQRVQQLAAEFNADEQLWRSLRGNRRPRRKLHPHLSVRIQKQLDLLDFATARPLEDRIRRFLET
jgi:hypothetical protein